MASVYQMLRELAERPQIGVVEGVAVHHFARGGSTSIAHAADVGRWLELRRRAFADERFAVRPWQRRDFESEMMTQAWWRPDRTWLAETSQTGQTSLVGSVTLADRGPGSAAQPAVHWLMVDPSWRRRGVGSLLMDHLEAGCWEAGMQRVYLETHAAWEAAVHFYAARGYVVL